MASISDVFLLIPAFLPIKRGIHDISGLVTGSPRYSHNLRPGSTLEVDCCHDKIDLRDRAGKGNWGLLLSFSGSLTRSELFFNSTEMRGILLHYLFTSLGFR